MIMNNFDLSLPLVTDTGDASFLRKALVDSIPKGSHQHPHAEGVTVRLDVVMCAIDHLERLEKSSEEWRLMALAAQAQVKHQAGMRESELVALLKDIMHCSDVFVTFRPDLHARLLDFGRRLKAQEPKDDFPDDYEV